MILWQDGSATAALQFYQLMGSHGVASVFTTSAWLAAEGGNVRSLPYPGSLNWRRQPLAGGVAYEFTVDPPTTGGYAFGFALDPDLGPMPPMTPMTRADTIWGSGWSTPPTQPTRSAS